MKKKLVFAMIFIFIFSFCFNFFGGAKDLKTYALQDSFSEFQEQFSDLVANDTFDSVFIEENEDYNTFINKINDSEQNDLSITTFSLNNSDEGQTINNTNIAEICEDLDLTYSEIEDGYEVYSKYESKRIIVMGYVRNSFGAQKVLTYENYNILSYSTEEETKFAYNNLILDDSLSVVLDGRIKLTDAMSTQALNYDYSKHKNHWGTDAIDLGYYNEYLTSNNSNEEVVVAVLDTGIRASHTAFTDRILEDASGNMVGYSYSTSVTGYFYNDGDGHGSHVSGIICDMTPKNVKILPMKVFSDQGAGKMSYVTTALTALTTSTYSKYNIVSANLSLGNADSLTDSELKELKSAFTSCFDAIREHNIIPIVAAGNEAEDTARHVPAVCENAITVSAITGPNQLFEEDGKIYYSVADSQDYFGEYYFEPLYSNYGDAIDIAAPGSVIYSVSSSSDTEYTWNTGTSMAAPHVAGAVALFSIDKQRPDDTMAQIEKRLYDCAIDLGDAGVDVKYGNGMLNFKNFNGNITYSSSDTTATYNGEYHNISVAVSGVSDYSIYYGFTSNSCTILDISTNDSFKNYTNGAKNIYFRISASGYVDTYGVATLTINKADVSISLENQSGVYGNIHSVDSSKYEVSSGIVYNSDNLCVNLTVDLSQKSPIGNYKIFATAANTNYNLIYDESNLKYEITKRPVSITLNPQSSEYGDEIYIDHTAYTISNLTPIVDGDNLNVKLTTNATNTSIVGNEYQISIVSTNDNYSVTSNIGTYEIVKKKITLTTSNYSYYGDEINKTLGSTYSATDKNGNNFDISSLNVYLTTTLTIYSQVGTYTSEMLAKTDNANYEIISNIYYYIYKRSVTITPKEHTSVYGETIALTEGAWEVTSGSFVNGETIEISLSTIYDSATAVGIYEKAISCSYNTEDAIVKNYNIKCNSGKLIVTQREITITPREQYISYGEEIKLTEDAWDVTNGSIVNGDVINVKLSTNANKGDGVYGEYIISLEATESDGENNYTIIKGTNNLYITPKDICITILDQDAVFGKEFTLLNDYTIDEGYELFEDDKLNIICSTTATSSSPVGSYEITLVSFDNQNYNIKSYTSGWLSIKGREVVLSILAQSFVYGEIFELDQTKFTSEEDVSSLAITLTTTANNFSGVGKYDIVANTTNSNVKLTYDGENKLEITARPLMVEIYNQTCIYGEYNLVQTDCKLGSTVNGDVVEIKLNSNADSMSNVGSEYKISATTTNINYSLQFEEATLEIVPKELTINLKDQTLVYGAIQLSQEENIAYTLSQSPYNNDNLNIAILTDETNSSNVGDDYEIYFSFNNSNYLITGENANLTITPREIEIQIKQTVEYAQTFIFDEQNYTVTSTNKVVKDDDLNLELILGVENGSAVGEYDIQVISNNDNYIVTIKTAVVEITKKAITVTACDFESVYGEIVDETTLLYETNTEIASGDDLGITLTLQEEYKLGIGTYDVIVNCNGEDCINYDITKANGTQTVTKRSITIKIEDQQVVYGADVKVQNLYEDVYDRLVNGDNLNINLSTTAEKGSSVGKYPISYTYDNVNYDFEFIAGYFYIIEGEITIEILPQSFVYGEPIVLNQLEFNVNIDIDKSSLGIVLSTNAEVFDNVGSNYIIDGRCTNANYTVVITKGTLSITSRPISIAIENQTIEYGNANLDQTKFVLTDTILGATIDNNSVGVWLASDATNMSETSKTYPIYFDWSNKNYSVSATNSAKVSISARQITIESIQYGTYGINFEFNAKQYSVKSGTVVNNDDLMLVFSTNANKYSDVNNYNLKIESANSNYHITLSQNSKFVLQPKVVKIAISQEKYYGDEIKLDSTKYTITSGGVVNNDSLNLQLTTTATNKSNIGTYPISLTDYNKNYNVVLEKGELIVNKRIVIIQAIKSGEYGNYFALDNSYEIVEGSLAFSTDDLKIKFMVPSANNYSTVGSYTLNMTYNNSNYQVEMNHISHFEIQPRRLTIEIGNQEVIYGDEIKVEQNNYKIKYGSVVNNDNINLRLITTATEGSNAGNYRLSAQVNNSNYDVKVTNGTFTISKRPITIKLNKQRASRGLTFELDQTKWEIIEGEILEGDSINVEIYTNAKKLSMMGNYKLMANVYSENYDVTVIEGKLFLNISFIDVGVVALVGAIIAVIVVKIIKRRKAKQDNQKLFDKWIKW